MSKISFYSNDFIGSYGVCFDGFLIPINPAGPPMPMAAVGRLISTGAGVLSTKRTIKINGGASEDQTADGTYVVNLDGTGTAQLTVKDANSQPIHKEKYSFVIDNHNNEVQFIATDITDLNDQPYTLNGVTFNLVSRGVGRKQ